MDRARKFFTKYLTIYNSSKLKISKKICLWYNLILIYKACVYI